MSERTTEQLKHLEFIQSIIARMNSASGSMKRFAIVTMAFGGSLARYVQDVAIVYLTAIVIIAFWLLDSQYLQVERAYRRMYDRVRAMPVTQSASFDLNPGVRRRIPFRELLSWSTCTLYIPLIALLSAVWYIID